MKQNEKLNALPKEVQNEVIKTLKAFTGCYVNKYEDEHYEVSVGVGITQDKVPYKLVAYFENTEIFTNEEINRYAEEVWKGCDMSAW